MLLVLVIATPLGYTLGFGHYAWRVGWANFLMATILCIVALATLAPVVEANLRLAQPAAGLSDDIGRFHAGARHAGGLH